MASKYEKYYDEWVRLYVEEGLNAYEIADRYGCSKSPVYTCLDKRGIERSNKSPYRHHYDEWRRLYVDERWDSTEIADEYDCDDSTVRLALDRMGIDRRSAAEINKERDYSYLSKNRDTRWDEAFDKMYELYVEEGNPLSEVADELGCSIAPVRRVLKKNGVEMRSPGDYQESPYSEHHDDWLELYQSGHSTIEIAEEYDCSRSTVHNALDEMGADLTIGPDPRPAEKRFWEKVDKDAPSDCWEWQGHLNPYGKITVDGKSVGAHRYSYKLHNEQEPGELYVCHHCDNPACVNPDHLYAGTHQDNIDDAVKRGQYRSGEDINKAKLDAEDVREIRRRWEGGESCTSIAKDFPVNHQAVYKAAVGKTWKHLD